MRKLHQHVGKQIVVPAWIAIHWVQNHAVFSQADDLTGNVLSVCCSDSKAAEQRICRQPQCKRLYSVFLWPRGKMEQLHRNLKPEARTIRQRLDGLAQSERIRAEYAELTALRKRFQATLDGADEEKVDYKKYRPREWFHEDFYYSMGATIRGILKDSGFSGTDNVGFSRETFDIEIGGYSKAEEQGKGYCAFFNTVMMLAFHDYLNRRSVHAPGWLLIDTPLLGFDEGAYTANGSLRSGLFEHLKLQAANQQIIILENTDHIGELDFSGNVNVITFTKDQTDGRYGYLDGVVDVAERPGVGRR